MIIPHIPKIIHSIAHADQTKWHPNWRECYNSWFNQFDSREFKFIMWSDEACEKFVVDEYSQFYNFYNNLPVNIFKIDLVRLLILHKFGGIYHDMDFFCYKNFYDFIIKNPSDMYFIYNEGMAQEYLQNSLIIAKPNNPFFIDCVEFSKELFNSITKIKSNYFDNFQTYINPRVLYLSGPILIQNTLGLFYNNFKYLDNDNQIRWYNPKYIRLLPMNLFNSEPSEDKITFTKHLGTNSWFNEENDKKGLK